MNVLVIDDNRLSLSTLKDLLSSEKGINNKKYSVVIEEDHNKGLDRVRQNYDNYLEGKEHESFDIVIVDMYIDEEGTMAEGLKIVGELSIKSPLTIVITAHPSLSNAIDSMRVGAWDYLNKEEENYQSLLLNSLKKGCNNKLKQSEKEGLSPNAQYVGKEMVNLIEKYPGKVVAILDQNVICVEDDYDQMTKFLDEKSFLDQPYIITLPIIEERTV